MSLSALPNALVARDYTYHELKGEVESSISEIRDGFRKNKTKIEDITEEINKINSRTTTDKILIGMTGVAFIIVGIALISLVVLFEGLALKTLEFLCAAIAVGPMLIGGYYSCGYGLWQIFDALTSVSALESKLRLLENTNEQIQNSSVPRLKAKLENSIEKISTTITSLEEKNGYYREKSILDPRLQTPLNTSRIDNLQEIRRLNALKISAANCLEEIST